MSTCDETTRLNRNHNTCGVETHSTYNDSKRNTDYDSNRSTYEDDNHSTTMITNARINFHTASFMTAG